MAAVRQSGGERRAYRLFYFSRRVAERYGSQAQLRRSASHCIAEFCKRLICRSNRERGAADLPDPSRECSPSGGNCGKGIVDMLPIYG